jgi:subtilase family serine protease
MRSWKLVLLLLVPTLGFAAQADRISGPIDSSQKTVLPGTVHPLAKAEYDQGTVGSTLPFSSVTLVMAPSPSQQAALDQLLAEQQDRTSPNYHKWLTPEQYADRFGLSQNDINRIGLWLQSQGLTVVRVARGRNAIVFSGTAAQIQSVFNTEIHRYNINGAQRIANATPLEVPAALSEVVTAVRGLTNFRFKPMYVRASPGIHPHYTATVSGQTYYVLAPGDIATLYDINSLYSATPTPIDGTGQQLAIVGQTDVYLADINDFRSGFGLSTIPSTCTTDSSGIVEMPCNTTNFEYMLVGTDYGVSSADIIEADLDLEWSGATARNAQIIFVNAPTNETSGGVGVALQYAIDNAVAPVISMSYGLCEAFSSPFMETELQQGNTEGITIMNSAGDSGSFACDTSPPGTTSTSEPNPPFAGAEGGIAVNYPASSQWVTGVGGTSIPWQDFTPSLAATYWGSNGSGTTDNGGSALTALIGQEAAWNDDPYFAQECQQEPTNAFCESGGSPAVTGWVALGASATSQEAQEDLWINSGGGGVSNCYNQTATACVSGFPRPTWQNAISISGVPTTERLVPDVSLLASPNFPGYIICTPMNALTGSGDSTSSCASGIATAVDTNFSLVGGTSAGSPIFAGIVSLINQYLGSAGLGNVNQTLYGLAKTSPSSFHRVTSGDNDVYCQAGTPTGQPAGVTCPSAGVAGFNATPADAQTGYNLVNGLGSVDANNLAGAWKASLKTTGRPTSLTISTNATPPVYQGAKVTFTATVTPSSTIGAIGFSNSNNGSAATLLGSALVNALSNGIPPPAGTATFATTSLPLGPNSISAAYQGNSITLAGGPSATAPTVTVLQPFALSFSTSGPSVAAGGSAITTITVTPMNSFQGSVQFTCSGLPSGATCNFPNSGLVQLNGSTAQTIPLTIATSPDMCTSSTTPITITGTSSSPAAVVSSTITLTVTKTIEAFTLSSTAKTFTVGVGGTASVQLTVNGSNGFVTNSITALPLKYTCSGIPTTAEISCQPQGNGQPTNATAVTVALVTTPVTSKIDRPFGHSGIFYAALLPGIFGLAFVRPRIRSVRMLSLIIVLGFSTLWLGSCGGSKNGNTGPSSLSSGGTPPGNYSVTINATTGGCAALTSSLTITLSVSANQ